MFGLVQVLTMLAVHLVCYLGIMGMVNTVGHLSGRKHHPDFPGYDIAWLAIPLLGHGYHNSHHAHPAAARTGLLDPIWPSSPPPRRGGAGRARRPARQAALPSLLPGVGIPRRRSPRGLDLAMG